MQKFYFNELEKIGHLNEMVITVLKKYNRKEYDTDTTLLAFLDEAAKTYQERGYTGRENQVLSVKAGYITALKGTHPMTLERITVRRNEMQLGIAFKSLQVVAELIRTDMQNIDEKINEAKQLAGQIIIAAMQNGLLDTEKISKIKTQQQIETMWEGLSADANIAHAQKRMLLLVSRFDVMIICEEILNQLK